MVLGFKQAGYDIIWANEFDPTFASTYKINIGDHVVVGDIQKVLNSTIPQNADIVIGGFPCQGFSIANNNRKKNGMSDPRNMLYKEMLRVIEHVKPKYFIAENVKGIKSLGNTVEIIKEDFESTGKNGYYVVEPRVVNAANYGVPQNRERVFFIGFNK